MFLFAFIVAIKISLDTSKKVREQEKANNPQHYEGHISILEVFTILKYLLGQESLYLGQKTFDDITVIIDKGHNCAIFQKPTWTCGVVLTTSGICDEEGRPVPSGVSTKCVDALGKYHKSYLSSIKSDMKIRFGEDANES